jgi:eukaryotic-like serine/threonine-protein kinase
VTIPTVATGTPYSDAAQALKRAGFTTKRTSDFSDSVAKGEVIQISPTGQARKFSTITITVSKGPELVEVPQITSGTSAGQATDRLERLGFQVKIVKHFGGLLNKVVGIDPPSGTMVPAGSTITLDIV